MPVVFASATLATATSDGLTVSLTVGDPWDANDPLVRQRPDLFSAQPPEESIRRTAPAVEQATAAPGERRNVRRG